MKVTVDMNTAMDRLNCTEKDYLKYALGGLMYTPAHNSSAADMIISRKYKGLHSMVFCLEDAIADSSEGKALEQLTETFSQLGAATLSGELNTVSMPFLFVRVKYPEQIRIVYDLIGKYGLLKGFIFPKFDTSNAQQYINYLLEINKQSADRIYGMPILESAMVSDIETRTQELAALRHITDSVKEYILNIRIGGNDFCSQFGLRRSVSNTIYDIKVVADLISDIVNVFSRDYVVSAPVWEYFEGQDATDTSWSQGLRREAELDLLNGLTGKTVIHPTQLQIINSVLEVSAEDYNDAISILDWKDELLGVAKGAAGNRMNEQKVHKNWAVKILIRAMIYGIKNTDIERKPEVCLK
ncbi:MAG: HpcH/HpaI aldolase/citrate lyase family protein [Oscillospiraceae bacterium]|nr:HpcH/HpaI aldolase/citrate lyase family protein [Oscillospiraceae bacterium]